jgi:hypothetical protein
MVTVTLLDARPDARAFVVLLFAAVSTNALTHRRTREVAH